MFTNLGCHMEDSTKGSSRHNLDPDINLINFMYGYEKSQLSYVQSCLLPCETHSQHSKKMPRRDGVMDSALASCAGGLGLIPAVGEAKSNSDVFFSRKKVVG